MPTEFDSYIKKKKNVREMENNMTKEHFLFLEFIP